MRTSRPSPRTAVELISISILLAMSLSACSTAHLELLEVNQRVPRVPAELLVDLPPVPTLRPSPPQSSGRSSVSQRELLRVHAEQMQILREARERINSIREWDSKQFGPR